MSVDTATTTDTSFTMSSDTSIWRWDMSIIVTKWLVICSWQAVKMIFYLLITLIIYQAGKVSSFLHVLSTTVVASRIFVVLDMEMHLCPILQWLNESFLAIWSSLFFDRVFFKRFLVNSSASSIHVYLNFRMSLYSSQISSFRNIFNWLSMTDFIFNFNFPRALLMISLNSLSFGSIKNTLKFYSLSRFCFQIVHYNLDLRHAAFVILESI